MIYYAILRGSRKIPLSDADCFTKKSEAEKEAYAENKVGHTVKVVEIDQRTVSVLKGWK